MCHLLLALAPICKKEDRGLIPALRWLDFIFSPSIHLLLADLDDYVHAEPAGFGLACVPNGFTRMVNRSFAFTVVSLGTRRL